MHYPHDLLYYAAFFSGILAIMLASRFRKAPRTTGLIVIVLVLAAAAAVAVTIVQR